MIKLRTMIYVDGLPYEVTGLADDDKNLRVRATRRGFLGRRIHRHLILPSQQLARTPYVPSNPALR